MTKTRTFDCLVVGETNVDLLIEAASQLKPGQEKLATRMNLVLGGSSSITAANLSRLGASVRFISIIGKDAFGRFIEDRLISAGVDISALLHSSSEATGLTIWISQKGNRAGLTYPGTIAMLKARDITAAHLESARHLHVGHYFLLSKFHSGAAALFAKARRMGLTTSLDCNYDPEERWKSGIQEVLKHTDVFFPNEDEARKLTGEATAEKAALQLARSARVVNVKLGPKGVLVCEGKQCFHVPARKVRVVDTTGAGDSFNAGFLRRFTQGASLLRCAESGIAAAARCVQKIGGTTAFERRR